MNLILFFPLELVGAYYGIFIVSYRVPNLSCALLCLDYKDLPARDVWFANVGVIAQYDVLNNITIEPKLSVYAVCLNLLVLRYSVLNYHNMSIGNNHNTYVPSNLG